ncbi:hypothetical protein [Aegicerativicinus sediminis]|uniref:hypothetical protein n=1 Tax=Aegicerativicinus sediminis TaxID=2893202 RepID=UPI001E539E5A|nr:hypothetical protein [Aegicerativicinus sediminis]
MASIQYSFNSGDDGLTSNINNISIEVKLPKFSFRINNRQIFRFTNGFQKFYSKHEISDEDYLVNVPLNELVQGELEDIYGFFLYHFIDILRDGSNINNYSFKFNVNTTDKFNHLITSREFEGIFYMKSPFSSDYDRRDYQEELGRYMATYGPEKRNKETSLNSEGLINLPDQLNKSVFIINKEAYELFKYVFGQLYPERTISDHFVLDFIQILVDLNGSYPQIASAEFTIGYTQLLDFLKRKEYRLNEEFFNYLKANFQKLFDFPIEFPELKTNTIKGTFEVVSEDEMKLSDLDFYDLSVEYNSENGGLNILRHNWGNSNELVDNKTDFRFNNGEPIVTTNINGMVNVSVKGHDGSILWENQYDANDEELEDLNIKVRNYAPDGVINDPSTGKPTTIKKLRGKVLQTGNKHNLNELTVLVQAKIEGDEVNRIVTSGTTDKSGNFTMDYPYGTYVEAQALVSIAPDNPVNLIIVQDSGKETISDDFIYILLTEQELSELDIEEEHDDCECNSPTKAKRLPDQVDLINSDEYTQDIGGSCINLTTPNRTLREYSYNAVVRITDPDVANYSLSKEIVSGKTKYNLKREGQKLKRNIIDLDNPVKWQDSPDSNDELSLYQAVTVATGHIVYFKSVFKADGYSLGDLVYSLPLAPGQKKQIVVFESTHSLRGSERQSISQGESLAAELINDRFITDQLSGDINESMRGRSNAHTSGMSAGLGIGVSYGGIGGSLGVAGGFANSRSSASQNSSRNISQFFGEKLRQAIMQNAESYRELNASVVTTVTEGQEYGVTAETVANHNHCHSLTMMYFEVLRHYAIFQEVSHVEECVFVPLLMTEFTTENISKWKDILAQNLLPIPSHTYLKWNKFRFLGRTMHPLIKAFDANDRIKTNYERVNFPAEGLTYADTEVMQIRGKMQIKANIPRPKTKYDRIKSFPIVTETVTTEELNVEKTIRRNIGASILVGVLGPVGALFGGTSSDTVEHEILVAQKISDAFITIDDNFRSVPPAKCIRVKTFSRQTISHNGANVSFGPSDFFEDGHVDGLLWETYAKILGYTGSEAVADMMNYYLAGRLISEWDGIFYNDILPLVFARITDSISIHYGNVTIQESSAPGGGTTYTIQHNGDGLPLDFSTDQKYSGGNRTITVNFNSNGPIGKTRRAIGGTTDYMSLSCSNEDVIALKNHIKLNIGRVDMDYSTEFFNGRIYSGYVNDDLLDGTNLYIPLTSRDKKDPRKEDEYLVNTLIEHLNSHIEHYNKILWRNLDPDRRYMLMDGFNIQTYTSTGNLSAMRSLASVLKNELITITGNSLVFPVADGYKVGRNNMLEEIGDNVFLETSLTDYYKPLTPMPPYRISIPTRGVFMEAIQGNCDACEMVKENSSQDWDKFRTEEPTPISPVTTPTPVITDYKPEYKDFATPMVNIQNAPDAPAPGVGLTPLSELLGKAGIFNDITGLAGNQDNVMKTYLSNQENAKAFAEMAKSLASQQHNTTNSRNISEGINQARRSGNLTEDDAQNLTRQHLQQQIDGGESTRENETLMDNPTVRDRVSRGDNVEYTSGSESLSLTDSESSDAPENNDLLRFIVKAVPPRTFMRTNGDESTVNVRYAGHFGFDYLRDEYIHPIETVLVDVNNASVNAKQPLVSNIAALKSEYLNGDPNPIQPYGTDYYPSWISIFPPRGISGFNKGSRMHEQGVKISLEIDEIDALDARNNTIELRPENPILSVSPSSINIRDVISRGRKTTKVLDSSNGNSRTYWTLEDAFTIRSGRGLLSSHTQIHIIARGENIEEQVGKIMMYQNDRIPKAELVMVRVSYDSANVTLSSQYHDILKNQSFNQALIRAEVLEDERFIINDLDGTDPDVTAFKASYPQGNNHNASNFMNDLLALYMKLGNNAPPAGSKRSIIFLTDESASAGGIADSSVVSGTFVWGNAVVVFGTNLSSPNTFVHEIGHSLSLPHIFSNALSSHKFPRGYTDNYMDYSTKLNNNPPPLRLPNPLERLYFFKWQWDIMRGDQSLIDNYGV